MVHDIFGHNQEGTGLIDQRQVEYRATNEPNQVYHGDRRLGQNAVVGLLHKKLAENHYDEQTLEQECQGRVHHNVATLHLLKLVNSLFECCLFTFVLHCSCQHKRFVKLILRRHFSTRFLLGIDRDNRLIIFYLFLSLTFVVIL